MDKSVGQNDIDALLAKARNNPPVEPASGSKDESYNFSRAGQIAPEQMRAITNVNDLFARNLTHTVGAWLRTEFQVIAMPGEQMAYSDFLSLVADPTYIGSLRLEPLGAVGLLEVDLRLALPMVDLLLGGTGRAEDLRPLTDIEELILSSVVTILVKELNISWTALGLQFAQEKRESGTQISRIMAAGEKVLCISFEVRMPEVQGVLKLCFPAVVLNTTLRRAIAERDAPRRRSEQVRLRVRELAAGARVGTSLQSMPVRLRARDIAALAPGDVLRLPLTRHAASELRVAGLRLAGARPVRMGEHRGARLEGPLHPAQQEVNA